MKFNLHNLKNNDHWHFKIKNKKGNTNQKLKKKLKQNNCKTPKSKMKTIPKYFTKSLNLVL